MTTHATPPCSRMKARSSSLAASGSTMTLNSGRLRKNELKCILRSGCQADHMAAPPMAKGCIKSSDRLGCESTLVNRLLDAREQGVWFERFEHACVADAIHLRLHRLVHAARRHEDERQRARSFVRTQCAAQR